MGPAAGLLQPVPITMTVVTSPKGHPLTFAVREDTNDAALAHGILEGDEYRLRGMPFLTGIALDVGAHIGTVAVALAVDNPDLHVIAIEPVPDNAALVRQNAEENGVAGRVTVLEMGVGAPGQATVPVGFNYTSVPIPDQGYVVQNRYIGNIWNNDPGAVGESVDAPVVTLAELIERYGPIRFCKIDCEGGEWDFFAAGADIDQIIGEWHTAPAQKIIDLLPEHVVTILDDHGTSGIFRAVR